MRESECVLCGVTFDVAVGLVDWADPIGRTFEAVPRCTDVAACRGRVEAAGERWPVADRTELRSRLSLSEAR